MDEDEDEWLWKCAERNVAERARERSTASSGNRAGSLGRSRLAFRAVRFLAEVSSRRASDQSEVAPGSAEVKHRTVPVLATWRNDARMRFQQDLRWNSKRWNSNKDAMKACAHWLFASARICRASFTLFASASCECR